MNALQKFPFHVEILKSLQNVIPWAILLLTKTQSREQIWQRETNYCLNSWNQDAS